MKTEWETVAIPIAKGIDINTRARLVEPTQLLVAENSRFHGGGAQKRRGHVAQKVRGMSPIPAGVPGASMVAPSAWEPFTTGDRGLPSDWVFGWGYHYTNRTALGSPLETSAHPDAYLLFGAAQRDTETLLWDGFRLFSRTPGQPAGAPQPTAGNAVIPHLRSSTVAKCSQTQNNPDVADNGTIRVVAWVNPVTDKATYTVLDSKTGATFVRPTTLTLANPSHAVRCIPVGTWVHVLVSDTAGSLQMFSVEASQPTTILNRSLGACDRFFDATKESETRWYVARNTGSVTVEVSALNADGSNAAVTTPVWIASFADAAPTEVNTVGIAVNPERGTVAVIARIRVGGTLRVYWRAYSPVGATQCASTQLSTPASLDRPVTVAPKYVSQTGISTAAVFDFYWQEGAGLGYDIIHSARASVNTPAPGPVTIRYRLGLASQAFRVGDRTYVWASHTSTYQSAWYLLDESLNPVGHLDYGTAATSTRTVLPSVNWSGSAPWKDTFVHHCALGYRVRVEAKRTLIGTNVPAVYAEPSVRFVQTDFLTPLRSAQAGRCTYFAGAQLWNYDGDRVVEAGFHHAPVVTLTQQAGGALTTGNKYRYRVDLCHRNAQGEEVRSNSLFTDEVTLSGPNNTIRVSIDAAVTRRGTDAYFLIFRNENNGTNWFLVNSRDSDAATFLANTTTGPGVTFDDAGAVLDADLITREEHPGNGGFGFIEPISAPACELVAAGADRLWVAGGELQPGQVAPSRLFQPGECPAFSPLVNVQVDRLAEAVTAIGFVGEVTAIFRRNTTYLLDGAGPDNSSNGYWPPARLAMAGLGAVSQESLVSFPGALAFLSPSGFRAVNAGGSLVPIGVPTDKAARDFVCCGSFASHNDGEIRWYSRSGLTYVYNYQYDAWSTFTIPAAGVGLNTETRLPVVAHPEGWIWAETDGVWTDGGTKYRQRIRLAWLRAGSLVDFQRVRRVAGVGEASAPHTVRLAVFYDEQDFEREVFTWQYPNDNGEDSSWNTDGFGNASFGAGEFGDSEA